MLMSQVQLPDEVQAEEWRLVRVLDRELKGFKPLGSGFILVRGRVAFVVTNEHVVSKAKSVPWVSLGKRVHESVSQEIDATYDLAVLRLGADVDISGETSEHTATVTQGQVVYSLGFPDDLGTAAKPLVSQGQVLWSGQYDPIKQLAITSGVYPGRTVSAFIVAGNACRQGASGGPVFDGLGSLVGYVKGSLSSGECLGISIQRALELVR